MSAARRNARLRSPPKRFEFWAQNPMGGKDKVVPVDLAAAQEDCTDDHGKSSKSVSTTLSQQRRKKMRAASSKYFFMDREGNLVDTAVETRSIVPRFVSEDLERDYEVFHQKLHGAGQGMPQVLRTAALVAAWGVTAVQTSHAARFRDRVITAVGGALSVAVALFLWRYGWRLGPSARSVALATLVGATVSMKLSSCWPLRAHFRGVSPRAGPRLC